MALARGHSGLTGTTAHVHQRCRCRLPRSSPIVAFTVAPPFPAVLGLLFRWLCAAVHGIWTSLTGVMVVRSAT
jgi:hypothetical protein